METEEVTIVGINVNQQMGDFSRFIRRVFMSVLRIQNGISFTKEEKVYWKHALFWHIILEIGGHDFLIHSK